MLARREPELFETRTRPEFFVWRRVESSEIKWLIQLLYLMLIAKRKMMVLVSVIVQVSDFIYVSENQLFISFHVLYVLV